MKNVKGRMDERILVCVYYGPDGEHLIKRGHKIAQVMESPLYVLTVDSLPMDEFDIERANYVEKWIELCDDLEVEDFIIRDNEKRPVEKVIAEVAHHQNITQIIIGQSLQNRWEEITRGSFINVLLDEVPFVDIHIASVDRSIKADVDMSFENGVRAFLIKDGIDYRLSFTKTKKNVYEGIFYKEIGTDFNNGIFKFITKDGENVEAHITDDLVVGRIEEASNINEAADDLK